MAHRATLSNEADTCVLLPGDILESGDMARDFLTGLLSPSPRSLLTAVKPDILVEKDGPSSGPRSHRNCGRRGGSRRFYGIGSLC